MFSAQTTFIRSYIYVTKAVLVPEASTLNVLISNWFKLTGRISIELTTSLRAFLSSKTAQRQPAQHYSKLLLRLSTRNP